MRLLCLLLSVISNILTCSAQWEKMPIGTTLYYSCKYTYIHSDENNGSEDSVQSIKSICLRIDTIISLRGEGRKIVLFSDNFDPSGIEYVDVPKKYSEQYNNNKEMCTMFYFFKHAIYGLHVSIRTKKLLRKESFIQALDDSLNQAIYYSTKDTLFSNYEVKRKKGWPHYRVIGGCEFTSFQFLLKDIHKKTTDSYCGEDPYFDFYGYYRTKESGKDEYILAKKMIDSKLIYSPTKGFLYSHTEATIRSRWDYTTVEMQLEKIEYPETNKR